MPPKKPMLAIRDLLLLMRDDPRNYRGKETKLVIYTNPNIQVKRIIETTALRYGLSKAGPHQACLVLIDLPEDCYNEVLADLQNDALIMEIEHKITPAGKAVQDALQSSAKFQLQASLKQRLNDLKNTRLGDDEDYDNCETADIGVSRI
jgi:hypothetical protein